MDPISNVVLPIFKYLIHKAIGDRVTEIGNHVRKAMEGQALLEFSADDEQLIYLILYEFKKKFKISHSTISKDSDSIVLAFPGKLDIPHVDFFRKQGINPKD